MQKERRAFTLIELLIVITIIGILAVALIPKIAGAPARARDAQRKADMNTIAGALESYLSDYGAYPTAATGGCLNAVSITNYFNASTIPSDPLTTTGDTLSACTTAGQYYYKSLDSQTHYLVATGIENDSTAATTAIPGVVKLSTLNKPSNRTLSSVYSIILSGETCNSGGVSNNMCVLAIAK